MKSWLLMLTLLGFCSSGHSPETSPSAGPGTPPVLSTVVLPHVFSNGMVLQRNAPVTLWGTGTPGLVTASVAGISHSAVVDSSGHWKVTLAALSAGGPYVMKVNNVSVSDVAVGDVWLTSGQSNMSWLLSQNPRENAKALRTTDHNLRVYFEPQTTSASPAYDTVEGGWASAAPPSVANWSAVAFYFGQRMRSREHIPIGVIDAAMAGTYIRQWMSQSALGEHPEFSNVDASNCYNSMIAPLAGLRIKGVLWYQGEAEAQYGGQYPRAYGDELRLLIADWRKVWRSDTPFYIVQLPNVGNPSSDPNTYSGFALVRDAQLKVSRSVPSTGLAITIDLGGRGIHSSDKARVASRLALAVGGLYGPVFRRFTVKDSTVHVYFDQRVQFTSRPMQFAIAGKDQKFVWAAAKASAGSIAVSNPLVRFPVAVRYAWGDDPMATVRNGAGIPASPFRSDDW